MLGILPLLFQKKRRGGGSAPNPPVGETAWWKAYSNIYSDAGITPATADGTALYRIGDNVGSANEDQSNATLRPLLKTAIMPSGKAVARYDGSDDYSIATLDGTGLSTLTIGCIIRPLDTSMSKGILSWQNSLNSGVPFVIVQRNGTDVRVYVDAGYRFTIPHDASVFKTYVLTYNGTQWGLVVNGAAQTPYVGAKAQQANAASIYLGNGYNGYANCDIGEVVVYNTAVDADALSTYLMSVAGL